MLKLHKRTMEPLSPSSEPPCPSHRIQFLDSPNSKRTRVIDPNAAPEVIDGADANVRSPQSAQPVRPDSPFVSSKRVVTADDVMALRPKRMRTPAAASPSAPGQEKIFSVEDVRLIVQRAIEEHENYIRAEYTRVLQERLNEQYASFAKFNQDAISRQLSQRKETRSASIDVCDAEMQQDHNMAIQQ